MPRAAACAIFSADGCQPSGRLRINPSTPNGTPLFSVLLTVIASVSTVVITSVVVSMIVVSAIGGTLLASFLPPLTSAISASLFLKTRTPTPTATTTPPMMRTFFLLRSHQVVSVLFCSFIMTPPLDLSNSNNCYQCSSVSLVTHKEKSEPVHYPDLR